MTAEATRRRAEWRNRLANRMKIAIAAGRNVPLRELTEAELNYVENDLRKFYDTLPEPEEEKRI